MLPWAVLFWEDSHFTDHDHSQETLQVAFFKAVDNRAPRVISVMQFHTVLNTTMGWQDALKGEKFRGPELAVTLVEVTSWTHHSSQTRVLSQSCSHLQKRREDEWCAQVTKCRSWRSRSVQSASG